MSATYEVFLVVLMIVAASGLLGVPKRLGIGDRSLQQAGPLTAVITSMAAAGLLSLHSWLTSSSTRTVRCLCWTAT